MLKVGEAVPDIAMEASNGKAIRFADFWGKKVILYFYPKDMTSGCTTEAGDFRDNQANFEQADTVVIGVSKDSMSSHHKFIAKHRLPFLVVSDPDLELINAFGVWKEKNMYGKKTFGVERTTFIIDSNGIVQKIYPKVKVKGHVEQILADLKEL